MASKNASELASFFSLNRLFAKIFVVHSTKTKMLHQFIIKICYRLQQCNNGIPKKALTHIHTYTHAYTSNKKKIKEFWIHSFCLTFPSFISLKRSPQRILINYMCNCLPAYLVVHLDFYILWNTQVAFKDGTTCTSALFFFVLNIFCRIKMHFEWINEANIFTRLFFTMNRSTESMTETKSKFKWNEMI